MTSPRTADRGWIRQSFMLPKGTIDEVDEIRRRTSRGYLKFSDTTLGGNQSINPPPQACKFSDIREKRLVSLTERDGTSVSQDMGRWYSENIDDSSVLLHLRAGVPAHNALTNFFGNFYSPEAGYMARTGKSFNAFFFLGRVAGFIVNLRFLPFIMMGQLARYLFAKPSTKFYYLKPAMPLFWNGLSYTLNSYLAQAGIKPHSSNEPGGIEPSNMDTEFVNAANKLLPSIWRNGKYGGIDVYNVANRYQRMANVQYEKLQQKREEFLDKAPFRYNGHSALTGKALKNYMQETKNSWVTNNRAAFMDTAVQRYLNNDYGRGEPQTVENDQAAPQLEIDPSVQNDEQAKAAFTQGMKDAYNQTNESSTDLFETKDGKKPTWGELFKSEFRDGSQFITFRVEASGAVSESFSNTVRDSELKDIINGKSNQARSFKHNFANGNIADNILSNTVEAVYTATTNVLAGFATQMGIGGLAALAGNAMVDIPKYWDGSTANLPTMSYSIELRAPYANEISRIQNLIFPTLALLNLALPKSTGSQSYCSPFLVEAYCKGRAQTRLAMIDSLSISRGEGNVGWTRDGRPLGININFSLVDMSSVMHVAVTNSFSPFDLLTTGLSKWLTTDDTSWADYMAVMSSAGLYSQVYPLPKLRRNFYKTALDFQSWTSPSHVMNWVGGWGPSRVLSGLFNATDRA